MEQPPSQGGSSKFSLVYKPTTVVPVNESAPIASYIDVAESTVGRRALSHALRPARPHRFGRTSNHQSIRACSSDAIRIKGGIVNWFIHRAVTGQDLPVYGSGTQVRDYVHGTMWSTPVCLRGGVPAANGMIFNVGSGTGVSFSHMADLVIQAAGRGSIAGRVGHLTPPPSRQAISSPTLASMVADGGPRVRLDDGIKEVVAKYQASVSSFAGCHVRLADDNETTRGGDRPIRQPPRGLFVRLLVTTANNLWPLHNSGRPISAAT